MKKTKKLVPQVLLRRMILVLLDAAIVIFSFYFALLLRADGAVEASWWPHNRALLYQNLPWIVALYLLSFLAGGLYHVLWKYAGERDLIRLGGMITVPTGVVYFVNHFCVHGVLFDSANAMAAVLIFLLVGGSRLAWRLFLNHPIGERLRGVPNKDPNRPVMIVGAGEAGAWAINVCKSNSSYGHPVVAVDDDLVKQGQTIHGVPVKGTLEQIPQLCTQYNIHNIIIAIPTLRGSRLNHVIDLCVSTHCPVQILSDPQLVGSNGPQQGAFRELNTADFLSRDEVTLDNEKISGYLTGKTVLVTGGGGSIGSELCRQVMRFRPGKLLIFDIYENCAYELLMELQQKYGRDIPVTVLIGSIRDKKRLDEVFETYHPTVVFHAAAHKHVPLMEISPAEAVKNNVLGTKNLLTSASEHDVERFVQLSTDKAVNPTSVMGCTKRICEMLIQTFAGNTDMKCVAVRFGNVLGSHGSVIPLFEAQIKKGGPVTLTDPNIEHLCAGHGRAGQDHGPGQAAHPLLRLRAGREYGDQDRGPAPGREALRGADDGRGAGQDAPHRAQQDLCGIAPGHRPGRVLPAAAGSCRCRPAQRRGRGGSAGKNDPHLYPHPEKSKGVNSFRHRWRDATSLREGGFAVRSGSLSEGSRLRE